MKWHVGGYTGWWWLWREPIMGEYGAQYDRQVCKCCKSSARIYFHTRKAARIAVSIQNEKDKD